jgi:hypothetical protein
MMSLFDAILSNFDGIAGKVGFEPGQVQMLASTLQSKLGDGTDHVAAIEQAAQEHGISVDTIQAILSHTNLPAGLGGAIGSITKGLFGQS